MCIFVISFMLLRMGVLACAIGPCPQIMCDTLIAHRYYLCTDCVDALDGALALRYQEGCCEHIYVQELSDVVASGKGVEAYYSEVGGQHDADAQEVPWHYRCPCREEEPRPYRVNFPCRSV